MKVDGREEHTVSFNAKKCFIEKSLADYDHFEERK
jgi:hypothetical protein